MRQSFSVGAKQPKMRKAGAAMVEEERSQRERVNGRSESVRGEHSLGENNED